MAKRYDVLATSILFFFLIALFAIIIIRFPAVYVWATYEDLLGEWTQVAFFAIALFFSLRLALSRSRFRAFFALLALACLYVVGEEISWGQRLFAITTPDFFTRHNLQQETNLHNLFTGPYRTGLKRAIEVVLVAGFILYGIVYPAALRRKRQEALWLDRIGIAAPPLALSPFFAGAALLEMRLFTFNEAEIAEILLSLALALFCLSCWQRHWQETHHITITSGRRALAILLLAILGTGLGAVITVATLQVPRLQTEMEARVEKGMMKFAERYGRYGAWDNAASLYQQLHERHPKNTDILRRLARSEQQLGNGERFTELNAKAIQLDMARYGRDPDNIGVNLSLHKTFLQAGFPVKAAFHLQRALATGTRETQLDPYNARAAYWLARCYLTAGDMSSAITAMKKAVDLQPESTAYRNALARITLRQKYGEEDEGGENEG
ncbi:MAG: tetratricopeptide repeat protein [Thermodesulfobacteriota bacterium]